MFINFFFALILADKFPIEQFTPSNRNVLVRPSQVIMRVQQFTGATLTGNIPYSAGYRWTISLMAPIALSKPGIAFLFAIGTGSETEKDEINFKYAGSTPLLLESNCYVHGINTRKIHHLYTDFVPHDLSLEITSDGVISFLLDSKVIRQTKVSEGFGLDSSTSLTVNLIAWDGSDVSQNIILGSTQSYSGNANWGVQETRYHDFTLYDYRVDPTEQ